MSTSFIRVMNLIGGGGGEGDRRRWKGWAENRKGIRDTGYIMEGRKLKRGGDEVEENREIIRTPPPPQSIYNSFLISTYTTKLHFTLARVSGFMLKLVIEEDSI